MGCKPNFSFISQTLSLSFLSLLFLSLFSLLTLCLLRLENGAAGGWSETAPTRRLAVIDGGALLKSKHLFFYFFVLFPSILLPKAVSNLKIPKYKSYIPRSKKKEQNKRERYYLYVLFGRWRAIRLPYSSLLGSVVCVSGCVSGLDGFTTVGFGLR